MTQAATIDANQVAIEAILTNIVGRIELGQPCKPRGPHKWYSHHEVDGFKSVRFHKSQVIPECLTDVPSKMIADAAANVNKHQLKFCTSSLWFTFRLLA